MSSLHIFLRVLFGTDSSGHALISSCKYALRGTSIDSDSRFPALLCAIDGRLTPKLASKEVLRIILARSQASENQSHDANVAHF